MSHVTFSADRPLVVTGAAGFIGAAIVRKVLEQGLAPEAIVAVDEIEYFANRDCTRSFKSKKLAFLAAAEFLQKVAAGSLIPGIVYHMGACSFTDETREDYLRRVNIEYTERLWKTCSNLKVPLIYASSGATYGAGEHGFSDDPKCIHLFKPQNLYGQSKQIVDLWVLDQQARGHEPPYWAGLKFFNVYGPIETHKGHQSSVVPHWRKQLLETGVVKLFRSHKPGVKDGEQSRDFVFVDDVVNVCLAFGSGKLKSGIYNVGTGQARTFRDLAAALAAAMGRELKIEFIDTPERLRAHYQYFTQATLENLRSAGYTAKFTSLEDGVRKYIERWDS